MRALLAGYLFRACQEPHECSEEDSDTQYYVVQLVTVLLTHPTGTQNERKATQNNARQRTQVSDTKELYYLEQYMHYRHLSDAAI